VEGSRDNSGIIFRFSPQGDSSVVDGHYQFGETLEGHAAPHDYAINNNISETVNRIYIKAEDAWFKIYINEDLVSEIRKDDLVFNQNKCHLGIYSNAAKSDPLEVVIHTINRVGVSHQHTNEEVNYSHEEYLPFDNQPHAHDSETGSGGTGSQAGGAGGTGAADKGMDTFRTAMISAGATLIVILIAFYAAKRLRIKRTERVTKNNQKNDLRKDQSYAYERTPV
jgi:hypothetical protein